MDDLTHWHGIDGRTVHRLEQETLDARDLMIAASASILETRPSFVNVSTLLSHGVDLTHFFRAARDPSSPLSALPHPLVGMFGIFDRRVDGQALRAAALLSPQAKRKLGSEGCMLPVQGHGALMTNRMRIVCIPTMFPNPRMPVHAQLVKQRLDALSSKVELIVISPMPWFPGDRYFLRYASRSQFPPHTCDNAYPTYFPKFLSIPAILKPLDGVFLGFAVWRFIASA